jgi:hypothetical protein
LAVKGFSVLEWKQVRADAIIHSQYRQQVVKATL